MRRVLARTTLLPMNKLNAANFNVAETGSFARTLAISSLKYWWHHSMISGSALPYKTVGGSLPLCRAHAGGAKRLPYSVSEVYRLIYALGTLQKLIRVDTIGAPAGKKSESIFFK